MKLAITLPLVILLLALNFMLVPDEHSEEFFANYRQGKAADFPQYTEAENQHLTDVMRVFRTLGIAAIAATTAWAAAFAKYGDGRTLFYGGMLTLALLILLASLPFSTLFGAVHQPLFQEGSWQFSPDSALIQTFPQEYWQQKAINYGLLAAAMAAACAFAGFKYRLQHLKL